MTFTGTTNSGEVSAIRVDGVILLDGLGLVLALPLVGSDDDVSNSVNSGSATKVTTSTNAVASSASSNFYAGSWYFDGSGDYLDVTESNNCFDFGTGDFTIELWAYLDNACDLIGTANNSVYLGSSKSGWIIRRFDSGIKFGYQSNNSWIFEQLFGTEGSRDKWNHISITREGNAIRCFSNGVQQGSDFTNSTDFISTEGYCRIGGGYGSTGLLVNGYIQDVRIYKGIAKYTSNFVVPATSPDILPDTPSGVSGSSKLAKVTDGAVNFDGSGDYLTGPSTDTFVSDAQYTIDGFIYLNSAPGNNAGEVIFDTGSGGSDPELNVFNNSGNIQLYESLSNNTNWNGGASYMGVKRWHYFKQTVYGSSATDASATHKLYIDGKLGVSNTINLSSRSASSVFAIGARTNGSVEIDAIISNFRYRSVLDDSLTVPTAPLTDVTNTKLLCCQSNTSAGAAAVSPNITGSINTGTVWSDLVIGTLDTQYGNVNRAWPFNGSTGSDYTDGIRPDSGNYLTMDFGSQFSSATSVKIYGHASLDGVTYSGTNENLKINGVAIAPGAWAANGGGAGQSSATFTISGLTSLAWGYSSGSQSQGYLYLQGLSLIHI